MVRNKNNFSELSFHDLMMSDDVKSRLRELMIAGDFIDGFGDTNCSIRYPRLLQNYSRIRKHSSDYPKYVRHFIASNPKKDCSQTLEAMFKALYPIYCYFYIGLNAFPSNWGDDFYEPLNTLKGYDFLKIPSMFSCKEKLIDLTCVMITKEILLSLKSYESLVHNINLHKTALESLLVRVDSNFYPRGHLRFVEGQFLVHRIIAEVTIDPKEFKLREQLSLLYT